MKKLSFIITAVVLTVLIAANSLTAQAQTEFNYTGSYDFDEFLQTFSTEYKDRTTTEIKTDNEYQAALYLAEQFNALGLEAINKTEEEVIAEDYLQSFTFGSSSYHSNNVIGIKPADTSHEYYAQYGNYNVVIGAHYDNVYGVEIRNPYTNLNYNTNSHGAYDNGSGITVMMSVANDLSGISLPFDVTFVAFGAEEFGMYGSNHYVYELSKVQRQNILLMINLDSISAGDYLYMFCMDWKSGHESFLRERAQETGLPLKALPLNKKFTLDPLNSTNQYSHYGYYSDNYYFMQENIPSAFFMTMNWESKKKAGVVESDNNPDIMHTENDTYEKLKEYYPDTYLLHMQYVSELVSYSVTHEGFAAAMLESRQNTPNYSFIMNQKYLIIAAFTIWLGFVAYIYIYYSKIKKIAQKEIKEYLNNPENIQKMNNIFKGMPGINPFENAPKPQDEKKFSVFGEEFEKDDKNDYKNDGGNNNSNDSGNNDSNNDNNDN